MTTQISGTTGVSLIQDNTVTSAKIVDGAISGPDLNGGQSGSAPVFGCRAWCMFDGTLTGTNAPTAGGNVTNVTRNAAGDYTINFTTAMPDANYACLVSLQGNAAWSGVNAQAARKISTAQTTTSVTIATGQPTLGTLADAPAISVAIFR